MLDTTYKRRGLPREVSGCADECLLSRTQSKSCEGSQRPSTKWAMNNINRLVDKLEENYKETKFEFKGIKSEAESGLLSVLLDYFKTYT